MNITADHWLEGVKRALIPGGSPMNTRRFEVVHFTSGATAVSSIEWWRNPGANGASAHVVIDRDGTIIQCRPFNVTAGHAGTSQWRDPKTGKLYVGLNSCSIGIELANAGADTPGRDAYDWAAKQPGFGSVRAKHKHGGPVADWEAFPASQLAACERVSLALVKRYNLDDIIGHEDIARGRKSDPGPAFPMAALRAACGFTAAIPTL
ncbi:N-acetylmuramoyl-L-alanine amidase [Luteolibacter flavescens]|uniref:N-acetylmuramoyl-L-alanine amidase n=1 Tax=Luteolibacter flavescens TaxID=1859460 RepID=A0ABT3FPM6_9BACT|nr:N-acetylmuramoyl-L-alanine amidase [Luteolibacter flavescens]MCW1885512.1 N-acetylmuramoyl-L-alanine amidase [Luteolibacter flavescens]